MLADLGARVKLETALEPVFLYLQRPLRLFHAYDRDNLRPDLVAGLTIAIVSLPQVIAFAILAGLPPQMGIYTAIVGAIIAALWGSSNHAITAPTNTISILVLSALLDVVTPGTAEFMIAAGLMAVMVGAFQMFMGLARLGLLVNFVSHSVIVGFATGAGILIAVKQLYPLLGLPATDHNLLQTISGALIHLPESHLPTVGLGIGAIIIIWLLRRFNPRLPGSALAMVIASVMVFLFGLNRQGVAVMAQLPGGFPPLARLPLFDLDFIARLSTGALAVGAISLVQTTAVTRSIASVSGQRLDNNQEFVGQGLANILAGFFSGFACSASFSSSAVNFKAGARTPVAAIFCGVFLLFIMLTLAPLAVYLPRAALAGVLIVTAYGIIDRQEIIRIWRGARGDAAIMIVTLLGTLFLKIEFAVLAGILLSFALYIMRTSAPRVYPVLPDDSFKHFAYRPDKQPCPQLAIIDVLGDLYFGAVNHIEEAIVEHAETHPEQRFLLIRMHHVNLCDFSGIHMLETILRVYRDRGGDVFLVRVNDPIRRLMHATGFEKHLGLDHFPSEDEVITHLFHRVLDPAICIYECPVRAFKECQNLPKRVDLVNIPVYSDIRHNNVLDVTPRQLWQQLHYHNGDTVKRPAVIDVREPREFKRGHIAEAELVPLPQILSDKVKLPNDRQIVLVCRSGRRSRRAAAALQQMGCMNVAVLQGGMLAWEAAGLLEAVE